MIADRKFPFLEMHVFMGLTGRWMGGATYFQWKPPKFGPRVKPLSDVEEEAEFLT